MNSQTLTPSSSSPPRQCLAFSGMRRIASGSFAEVAVAIKRTVDVGRHPSILMFDASTSELLEVDTRGSVDDVARRYAGAVAAAAPSANSAPGDDAHADGPRPRGRPKLGVVAREVTLLPRHWDWLGSQPGGASVSLRKLVEQARRTHAGRDVARKSREAAYRFMSAIAGGQESFEEATRALFAGDRPRFEALLADWPAAVRIHAMVLAQASFEATPS